MNIVPTRETGFGKLATAGVALLLAASTTTFAQHNNSKPSSSSHSSAPHQSSPPPRTAQTTHQNSQPPQRATPPSNNPHPSGGNPSGSSGGFKPAGGGTSGGNTYTPNSQASRTPGSNTPGGGQAGQGGRTGQSSTITPSGNQGTRGGTGTSTPGSFQGNRTPQNAAGGRPGQGTGTGTTMPGNSRMGSGSNMPGGTIPGGNRSGQPNNIPGGGRPGSGTGMNPNASGGRPGSGTGMNPNASGGRPGSGTGMNPNASGGRQFGGGNGFNGNNGGRPSGTTVVHTRNGGDVIRGSNGSVREVHTAGGAVIHHAPTGVNRIEQSRPGGRVIVANGRGGSGYVQRPLVINHTTFVQRTYVYHGVSYARVYRPYVWGGVSFSVYTPYRFYRPAFYGFVFSPWVRPVYYSWGWGGSPWFGFYGGFFTPYPYYASPSLWLTDYLIAQTLQDAYQARLDAAAAASLPPQNYGATPLTPEVKQAIADEVHRQIDAEKNGQQNIQSSAVGAPPLVSTNGPQVFVVSNGLTVNSAAGECPVTEGDVLQMNSPPPQNSTYADVVVLASKGQDCRKGSTVSVALNDLQEMQNQMRATIDQGLGDLQSKQGQNGLPTLPAGAAAPPDNAFGNQVQPDANVQTELTQVAQDASRAEQDVVNQSLDNSGGNPPTISLGMTTMEVEQIMGRPKDIANVGSKKIYVYPSMKVIFIDGKVNDVQ